MRALRWSRRLHGLRVLEWRQTEDGQKQLTIVIGVDRAASVPETPAP